MPYLNRLAFEVNSIQNMPMIQSSYCRHADWLDFCLSLGRRQDVNKQK